MDTAFDIKICLTLTQQEFNLIGLALCGKIKHWKQQTDCMELNRKLLEARLREHQHHAALADKALAQVEELCTSLAAKRVNKDGEFIGGQVEG